MSTTKRKRESGLATAAEPIKRFQCDFNGCGKTYSRAEHLARHQLNHSPRQIFRCEFPGCDRWFVRQDLCARHYERHFQDRDTSSDALQAGDSAGVAASRNGPSTLTSTPHDSGKKRRVGRPKLADKRPPTPPPPTSLAERTSPCEQERSSLNAPVFHEPAYPPAGPNLLQHYAPGSSYGEFASQVRHGARLDISHLPNTSTNTSTSNVLEPSNRRSDKVTLPSLPAIEQPLSSGLGPPVGLQPSSRARGDTGDSMHQFPPPFYDSPSAQGQPSIGASNGLGFFSNFYDQFGTSPGSSRNDEFTSWLFDDLQASYTGVSPIGLQTQVGVSDNIDNFYATPFPEPMESFGTPGVARQHSQSQLNQEDQLMNMGDHSWLSEDRWRHLIEFLKLFFNDSTTARGHIDRDAIFGGNLESEDHVLSFKLMNAYIVSYWHSYHEQMPILHKPTFLADEVPELLLLAVMMIGAAHIPSSMGVDIKSDAHHFATFVAWHLRWHIFMHDDFHPPAKLWIFQALILLEVYEKMKATRFLHERATLHNATTISLIRRGTALVDSTRVPNMAGGGMTPKEWWDRWVTAEATRRAAFAAFLTDASHASMFGHSNVMVAHEIQLSLPCDDALWSATSPSEVGRVEASLYANNVRPLTFLHGLKRMLGGRKVRTNAFGRMVLLAGLQSVCWHMRQREKVSNLGKGLGAPEVWRQTLTRAFDFWKKDFDEDFSHRQRAFVAWQNSGALADSKMIAEYASAMHHLSHLAMQLDVIEAQIMAGASRLVSRTITDADRERVSRKLSHWRDTPGADLAFHHATQLLLDYFPEGGDLSGASRYNISDDSLTIRPWTLYYAALTAWCYIFVKQHPNEQPSAASSDSSGAMESRRASPEREPAGNSHLRPGQNSKANKQPRSTPQVQFASRPSSSLGLQQKFGAAQLTRKVGELEQVLRQSSWELLREAAERLHKALDMLAATDSR